MPEERGYQARVAPGGPGRAVLTDADAYGAGVGRALERGGEQLHQRQIRDYKLDRQEDADAEAADVMRRSAEARVRMDQRIRESRTGPVPGAKGHAAAIQKALEEERTVLLDGIAEDSIRRSAATNWDEYASRTFSAEDGYEMGRRVDLDIANHNRAGELAENRITSSRGDKAVYEEELTQGYGAINALQNVTPEEKEKLKTEHERSMTMAWLEARNNDDPATVKFELGLGVYDGLLSPEQVARLDRGAEVELRAQRVEAEAAASQARTSARNDLETLEARTEAGDIPAAKDAAAVIQRARAAGVPEAEIIRLTTKVDDAKILRTFNPANDPDGAKSSAEVARIDERIRSGVATPEEYRLRERLQKFGDARATDAGAKLKEIAASGPAGQIAALEQLHQLKNRTERFTAAQALGGNLGHIALLPNALSREMAIKGKAVLASRPKDFGDEIDISDRFAKMVGAAAPSLGGDYGAMKSLAWQIYAGQMNANGETGWNKSNFDLAVRVAFGATKRRNGALQGGIGMVRGRSVILPDTYTANEFDAALSRLSFADAVYADGSPVNKVDVLSRYRPELYDEDPKGGTFYRMVGPGNKPLFWKGKKLAYPVRMPALTGVR